MMEVLTDDATDGGGRNRLLDEAIASGSTVSCKYILLEDTYISGSNLTKNLISLLQISLPQFVDIVLFHEVCDEYMI